MRFFLMLGLMVLISCNTYYKGGYYFTDEVGYSYYGNDRKHLYIQLSDKFLYSEENFNAKELNKADVELLNEFNLKPRNILFSYHSTDREAMTFLMPKNRINLVEGKTMRTAEGVILNYQSFVKGGYVYRKNLSPYKNRYLMVIEKTLLPAKQNQMKATKTLIFPKITSKKPIL